MTFWNEILATIGTRWTTAEEIAAATDHTTHCVKRELCRMYDAGLLWRMSEVKGNVWTVKYCCPHDISDVIIPGPKKPYRPCADCPLVQPKKVRGPRKDWLGIAQKHVPVFQLDIGADP